MLESNFKRVLKKEVAKLPDWAARHILELQDEDPEADFHICIKCVSYVPKATVRNNQFHECGGMVM